MAWRHGVHLLSCSAPVTYPEASSTKILASFSAEDSCLEEAVEQPDPCEEGDLWKHGWLWGRVGGSGSGSALGASTWACAVLAKEKAMFRKPVSISPREKIST